jgi:ech hydrogenase subunit D
MIEEQKTIKITKQNLLEKVRTIESKGYRLVQIQCTRLDRLVIDYTFDDENLKFINYRLELPKEKPELPSITSIYFAAFTYENELHDLFGIKIDGNALDFGGKFYRIDAKQPFNSKLADQEV